MATKTTNVKQVKASRSAEELLKPYSAELQTLIRKARSYLLEALPGATEEVDATAPVLSYGYGPNYSDMVCTLILSKSGVKLGFVRGGELKDPKGLLEGGGKVHKYVQLQEPSDLNRSGLKELVKVAHEAWKKRQTKKV